MTGNRVWIPKAGHFGHFLNRHALRWHRGTRKRFQLHANLPVPTLPIDWAKSIQFPILGNDQYGDCMYVAGAHTDQSMTGCVASQSQFDQPTLVAAYKQLSGGDNGLDEGTLVPAWEAPGIQGVTTGGVASILDALDIDPTNAALVQSAMFLFGPTFFMLDVPLRWINNFDPAGGAVWDAPANPDPMNGHGVCWTGTDLQGRYRLQTWGSYVWITPAGVARCDPSGFTVFSLRWFNAAGYAPNGYHYTQLAAFWVAAGGKALPPSPFPQPVPPTPTPTPTPTPIPVPVPPGPVPTPPLPVPPIPVPPVPSPTPTPVGSTVTGTFTGTIT